MHKPVLKGIFGLLHRIIHFGVGKKATAVVTCVNIVDIFQRFRKWKGCVSF